MNFLLIWIFSDARAEHRHYVTAGIGFVPYRWARLAVKRRSHAARRARSACAPLPAGAQARVVWRATRRAWPAPSSRLLPTARTGPAGAEPDSPLAVVSPGRPV